MKTNLSGGAGEEPRPAAARLAAEMPSEQAAPTSKGSDRVVDGAEPESVAAQFSRKQLLRAAELLEVIVRPGEHDFGAAIDEAQVLFGYWKEPPGPKKRGRPRKKENL